MDRRTFLSAAVALTVQQQPPVSSTPSQRDFSRLDPIQYPDPDIIALDPRFRRYIGDKTLRPLLPEHDLRDKADLITPNTSQTIRLIACGKLIQFWRDDRRIFEMVDEQPYTSGHFAFRTVANHMEIRRFRLYRLVPKR